MGSVKNQEWELQYHGLFESIVGEERLFFFKKQDLSLKQSPNIKLAASCDSDLTPPPTLMSFPVLPAKILIK